VAEEEGLPQALACRLDSVLAWARPAGGAGRGDETQGSGARKVVCQERWFAFPTFDRWEGGESPRPLDEGDVDSINDASKPLCLALPPRIAARLTVEIAERVDRRLAALPDERIAANRASGEPLFLIRAHHRKTHLDEIE
jgi:hypothetical protein